VANEYSQEVRREARRLWLSDRFTDAEIAAKLGIPRADTIRDWRHEEGWAPLAKDISDVLGEEVKREIKRERAGVKEKYAQLAQILESRAIRFLNNPALPARDLKSIAGTLQATLKMRDKLVDPEEKRDKFSGLAERLAREDEQMRAEEFGEPLGRCRGERTDFDADATFTGVVPQP
jgi:hypothetical protein